MEASYWPRTLVERGVARSVPPAGLEPALPAPEADALSAELRGRTSESSNRPLRGCPYAQPMPRILLVDDDPAILRLLDVNFRMEGFDVEATSHGEEALARAAPQ